MGPILYMNDMGVDIKHFGFFQGALAGVFALASFSTPFILKRYALISCFKTSMWLLSFSMIGILFVSIFVTDHPILITVLMSIYVFPFVIPCNALYPLTLEAAGNSKSKASALVNFGRLLFSAIGLEIVGYFYTGEFFPIALFMTIVTLISLYISFTISSNFFRKSSSN